MKRACKVHLPEISGLIRIWRTSQLLFLRRVSKLARTHCTSKCMMHVYKYAVQVVTVWMPPQCYNNTFTLFSTVTRTSRSTRSPPVPFDCTQLHRQHTAS